jgi:hypothetical protein
MKDMRETNTMRLIEWAAFCGERNPRRWLADQVGCSISTINRVFGGATPGPVKQLKIARATKIGLDELFPVSKQEKSA